MPKFESYQQGTPTYVELITPDQSAARSFYGDLFGWDYDETQMDEGSVYLTARLQGDDVAGVSGQMPELAGHPAFWNVYLAVDDVDAAVAKVEPAGGKVEAGPFDIGEHGRMAALQDPTGARISLWQAKDNVGTARANEPGTPIWNELMTPDIEQAKSFYGEVLGVTWEETPMPDMTYTTMHVDGRAVAGVMPPPMEGMPPHWNVYFNVQSVDETVAAAEAKGATTVAPAFDVPEVGRMAVLADPQGGMFSLMQTPS
ncbi:VOC family protein [Nocardioides sp.]|uniref:VOC family protein n=1 Tax=Nocardioides sp. TaxID=35761 RepID=UPI003566F7C4